MTGCNGFNGRGFKRLEKGTRDKKNSKGEDMLIFKHTLNGLKFTRL